MSMNVFSGIKPSGDLHLGNYLGAIKQWVKNQDQNNNIFCVVDLHAITVSISPEELRTQSKNIAAWYIACGINPEKSIIFIQSQNQDHPYLSWLLNNYTSIGQLNRMTQFKDKKDKQEFISVGLYNYPVLMASDILLYDSTAVPVGDDQKQHVELARDIADRFNNLYGETFVQPEYMAPPMGARVMSIQRPDSKMSKSEADIQGTVYLHDSAEDIRKKINSAVTDSGNEVIIAENKPAISNLIAIYCAISDKTPEDLDREYSGNGYKKFKEDLAEIVIEELKPIQERFAEIVDSDELATTLSGGLDKAQDISSKKIKEVKNKIGFY